MLLISQLKCFGSMLSRDNKRPHKYRRGVLCVGYGSGASAKSYRPDSEGKDTPGGCKLQANDEHQLFRLLPLGVTGAYPSNYGL